MSFDPEDHRTYHVIEMRDGSGLKVTEASYNMILNLLLAEPDCKRFVFVELLWGGTCLFRADWICGLVVNTPEGRAAHVAHDMMINKEFDEVVKANAPKEWE